MSSPGETWRLGAGAQGHTYIYLSKLVKADPFTWSTFRASGSVVEL
jgi:hypothetical protein